MLEHIINMMIFKIFFLKKSAIMPHRMISCPLISPGPQSILGAPQLGSVFLSLVCSCSIPSGIPHALDDYNSGLF